MIRRPIQSLTTLFLVTSSIVESAMTCFATINPTPEQGFIAKIAVRTMEQRHYGRRRFDDELSSRLFDEYIRRLDHQRSFLLQSDIDDFSSYRYLLDDLLKDGQIEFPFKVYQRYLAAVERRIEYLNDRLTRPFDFNADDDWLTDRSREPWCKGTNELNELWNRRLKNEILSAVITEMVKTGSDEPPESLDPNQQGYSDALKSIRNSYDRYLESLKRYDAMDIFEVFLNAFATSYDPHSAYMAPATRDDFDISMKLSLEGIGAMLRQDDDTIRVVEIIPGGPADRDGRLTVGHLITAVRQEDGEAVNLAGMPLRKAVQLIRGPKGSRVFLTVTGDEVGEVGDGIVIDLVRDTIKLEGHGAKMTIRTLTPASESTGEADASIKIGVIDIPSFYSDLIGKQQDDPQFRSVTKDVAQLLRTADKQHVDGLILDLRSNSGGSLQEAVRLTGLFVGASPIVQVKESKRSARELSDVDVGVDYFGPLVVLVDRNSASASEILAGFIQDCGRGVIIGEGSTHGKGTVQTVYDLQKFVKRKSLLKNRKPGTLKITFAKFYRISGDSTQIRGVVPDIVFPSFRDHMQIGERYLSNTIGWDQIDPVRGNCKMDVGPYISALLDSSRVRLGADPAYQEYVALLNRYPGRHRETVSLRLRERLKSERQNREWMKSVKRFRHRFIKGSEKHDWVLTEALAIMKDLILLTSSANSD